MYYFIIYLKTDSYILKYYYIFILYKQINTYLYALKKKVFMKRAEKREHLIEVATKSFNRLGYHATGIDFVIAEAGIAKTTLYRYFKSKDDLIVAVLDRIDDQYRENMREFVDKFAKSPIEKLLSTFDFLENWFIISLAIKQISFPLFLSGGTSIGNTFRR